MEEKERGEGTRKFATFHLMHNFMYKVAMKEEGEMRRGCYFTIASLFVVLSSFS